MGAPKGQPRRISQFLYDLYTLRSWEDLTTHVVNSIPSLIPTDICSYNEMSSRRRFAAYRGWPANHPTIPNAAEILGRYTHQHPVITNVERTRDVTAHKITDFVSQRQFRRTDLYNEFYRPLQLPYNMGACIAVNHDSVLAIGLNRVKSDFGAHDLVILDLLHPHLIQAYGNARTVSAMQEQLAAMNQAMEELDRAIVSVSEHGLLRWTTPRAEQLLRIYRLQGKRRSKYLASPLREWLQQQMVTLNDSMNAAISPLKPLMIAGENGTLRIRFVLDANRRLLFLEEVRSDMSLDSLTRLGLSQRETEVLSWVVRGKTNPEIGTILGISTATVRKHLEHVYSRLGVENRHAAITIALEIVTHQ